jgi:hypothetical protein
LKDERRRGTGRQDAQKRLGDRCDLGNAGLNFGALVEKNFNDETPL